MESKVLSMAIKRRVWKEKFGDWYREIIDTAKIIDYRYPIKGCGVWLPYGFKLREHVLSVIRGFLDGAGHNEMLFPTLIPEDLIAKESTHIKSFEDEAYWITHGGKNELGVKLALRPTSETAITPMVKLWVRSHADLPLKIYQIGSIFRYETKATRPLIRVREVSTFKEAHTFHVSHEEASAQVLAANDIYAKIFDELCVPYVVSERPSWDRFAGALSTFAFDTIFPDGRCLQIGTSHDLGQNFSKVFDLTFEDLGGKHDFVWQTSYGISERAIAAVIAVHGDDRGLVIPPKIAPIQVVVVPILYKGFEEQINSECQRVEKALSQEGVKVEIDDRPKVTPGAKFYEWESKGVPLRIEIGPRDVEQGKIILVRRDTGEKIPCKRGSLSLVGKTLTEIEDNLRNRAWKVMEDNTSMTGDLTEARRVLNKEGGIVEVPWCGQAACGQRIEGEVDARVLGLPVGVSEAVSGECPCCGKKGEYRIRVARTY
jgi:prolyl-tRNA synthetase